MDSASQGAADLLMGLGRAAVRFGEMGQVVYQAHAPFVRWEPYTRLAVSAVAVGMMFTLPDGGGLDFEVTVVAGETGFRVEGGVTLDGESLVRLPAVETAHVQECLAALGTHVDKVTEPAGQLVGERLEALQEVD
ncbi:hypothetical protein [Sinosporangium siamense]|uniref:Uncharacterized protein n=1 Tax=Sinosporangium siamense TaxID=1367973 RepID=A0A919V7J8_9ACTN|nr:hypothetical protein [Sinosporangium siamense]GII93528.1 hypothetical protein Ssi02_37590 [Sinosporangium siamense]